MTPSSTLAAVVTGGQTSAPRLLEGRRARKRLTQLDREAADRAERFLLRALLVDAGSLVTQGWVQYCWFTVLDEHGERRRIGPPNLHELAGRTVSEVCLVGAIVQAAGGLARAGSPPVHRAIDLTWATLYNDATWRRHSPAVRLAHVHDLTRWNDAPVRTSAEVAGLLTAASERTA